MAIEMMSGRGISFPYCLASSHYVVTARVKEHEYYELKMRKHMSVKRLDYQLYLSTCNGDSTLISFSQYKRSERLEPVPWVDALYSFALSDSGVSLFNMIDNHEILFRHVKVVGYDGSQRIYRVHGDTWWLYNLFERYVVYNVILPVPYPVKGGFVVPIGNFVVPLMFKHGELRLLQETQLLSGAVMFNPPLVMPFSLGDIVYIPTRQGGRRFIDVVDGDTVTGVELEGEIDAVIPNLEAKIMYVVTSLPNKRLTYVFRSGKLVEVRDGVCIAQCHDSGFKGVAPFLIFGDEECAVCVEKTLDDLAITTCKKPYAVPTALVRGQAPAEEPA